MKKHLFSAIAALVINGFLFGQSTKQELPPALSVDSFAAKIERQNKPQIIDARKQEEFIVNHIIDAVNIDQFAGDYLPKLKQLNQQQPVFIYAIQNYRPGILAKELLELGFEEVYILHSGIASWIGAGYPYYSAAKNIVSLDQYNAVLKANKLVVVNIGTKYCGICVSVKQVIDSLRQDQNRSFAIEEIDLYHNPELVAELKEIRAVPTVLVYKEGKVVWKRTGLNFTKSDIETVLSKAKLSIATDIFEGN